MPRERIRDPVILGVVGDSAAGKTTLSAGIAEILGRDRVAVICSDDYHRYSRAERAVNGLSAIDPRCNYMDILELHLEALRRREPILKPIYNHSGGTLDAPEYVEPKPYIIVEGLLGFTTRPMRKCYDVKVYLAPEHQLRVKWKVQRDTQKRGYTPEQVMEALHKRKDLSPQFIGPQRTFADLVISFYPPEDDIEESGEHLCVQHTMRPTLPHPDLSPMLGTDSVDGLSFTLARDDDGKPVDLLTIGRIGDDAAQRLEELLWDHIPEASHLQQNVGRFTTSENTKATSHPLALTQLIITYHMVKAALGVHAV